ncbi:lactonase family protein [Rhizobium sp. TRM96647]|uniref:lactonase family protein n=1 Tax=unclassified Rhizobium TaxID=2613769 RepID=UPI0021E817AE|nr:MULTISPECIES: lactonase family protein [unclassified Rhizobium]MCV3737325.1 lactonase family protein [Rhizobium sp. TRM96647]MCV3759309.1 lactonase family protein [Rhizobium sp. TRM96650]
MTIAEQACPPDDFTLVVGSYTHSLPHVAARGQGISVLRLSADTGRITPVSCFTALRNPTYLALADGRRMLYAVEEMPERDGAAAVALSLDPRTGDMTLLARVGIAGDCPCHVSLDREARRLFVSNYGSGNLFTFALDAAGMPTGVATNLQRHGTGPNESRQEGPHVHQATVTPDGSRVLVCDAGTDEIARHAIGGSLIDPQPDLVVKTKGGHMPRHLAFSTDGTKVFVVHELGCTVGCYAYSQTEIRLLDEVSTLPDGFEGKSACAAIRVHPGGRFVYASNRGHDTIAAFEVDPVHGSLRRIGWYPTRGAVPRDFAIDPGGRYLAAANQDGHCLSVFSIDRDDGSLTPVGETFETGSPVCVLFA